MRRSASLLTIITTLTAAGLGAGAAATAVAPTTQSIESAEAACPESAAAAAGSHVLLFDRGGSLEPGFYRHTPGSGDYRQLLAGDSVAWNYAYATADSVIGHSLGISHGDVTSVSRHAIPLDTLLMLPEVAISIATTAAAEMPAVTAFDNFSGKTVAGRRDAVALAPAPDGSFFAICSDGILYRLDTPTGQYSVIGQLGVTPSADPQGACYDPAGHRILWAASCSRPGIYSVNATTGAASLLEEFIDGRHAAAIFPAAATPDPEAPGAPAAPSFVTVAPGSLDGILRIASPAVRGDNSPILSPVRMELAMDGVTVRDTLMRAGDTADILFSAPQGMRRFSVRASADGRFSPASSASRFVGLDAPATPFNAVVSTYSDQSLVMWEYRNAGANGGYVNPADVFFRVVRQPGNVAVNDSTHNLFTNDDLPSSPRGRYRYEVTAIHHGLYASAPASTLWFTHGDAYAIPWSLDLSDSEDLREFNTTGSAGDFPMSIPPLRLESSTVYRLRLQLDPAQEIDAAFTLFGWGNGPTVLLAETDSHLVAGGEPLSMEFQVPAAGIWDLRLACNAARDKFTAGKISVEKIGKLGAPQAPIVTDIKRKDNTLTFLTRIPTRDLGQAPLTRVDSLILRRDGAKIASVASDVSTGALSIRDANPPARLCHYSLTLKNPDGEGRAVEVRIYPRPLTLPFATDDLSVLPEIDFGDGTVAEVTVGDESRLTAPIAGVVPLGEAVELPNSGGIALRAYCPSTAPAAPEVAAAADPRAPHQVVLEIKTPRLDIDGNPLQAPLSIEIRRGANALPHAAIHNLRPGEKISWTDAGAPGGDTGYTVRCASASGYGLTAEVELFTGFDIPAPVEELKIYTLDADNARPVISWESPSRGEHGGVIDDSEIYYDIYRLQIDESGEATPVLLESWYGDTSYSLSWQHSSGQQTAALGVSARCGKRTGSRVNAATTVGAPLTLPFIETFHGGAPERSLWTMRLENPREPQFGTGGCWRYEAGGAYADATRAASLISPTIRTVSLQEASLQVSCRADAPATLAISAECNGELLEIATLELQGDSQEWQTFTFDVKDKFTARHGRLVFTADGPARIASVRMLGTEDLSGIGAVTDTADEAGSIFDLHGRPLKEAPKGNPAIINGEVKILP